MSDRPTGFYTDFEVFAAELARAREALGQLDASWLGGLTSVVGTSAGIAAGGTAAGLLLGGLGILGGPVGIVGAGVVAGALAARSRKKQAAAAAAERHAERLRRGQRVFRDLNAAGDASSDHDLQVELDALFDDLLHDRPIYT